jgi:sulfate transport system ATP-binding protein
VLLLDEPFGALDAKLRKDPRRWRRRPHDDIHITSVFVTHDQEEALEVADRVVVMNEGRTEQVGTSAEAYARPHEIEVLRDPGREAAIPAILQRAIPVGPRIRLQLNLVGTEHGIEAEVGREAWRALDVLPGARVFLRPRRLRVFPAPAPF